MIRLVDITKSFVSEHGRHLVLDNVNFHFPRGVNTGILGLNGAGKSTLLKLISGEIHPDRGAVIRSARISWPLGFMGGFHGSLTGRENLRFVCRIYNADIAKATDFVEQFSALGKFMDYPMKTYSTGMRAKLAFGLSMAIDFECYLVDEITAVGDMTFRSKCEQEFERRRKRSSLIVVSHSAATIAKFCDRVAVIHDNSLVPFDSVKEGVLFYKEVAAQGA